MLLDNELMFSKAQAVTSTAASTNVIDLGPTHDAGVTPGELELFVKVDEAATAAGAATVTLSLETDDNVGFSSATTILTTAAIGKATLVLGYYALRVALPRGCERYLRLSYTVATGPLTAGKFTAGLVRATPDFKVFPDNVVWS